MREYVFDAPILKQDGLAAAFVEFSFDVEAEFGTRGQVKVRALFDGAISYRGSLARMGHRRHILGLSKEIRAALGKQLKQDQIDTGVRNDGLTTAEREELRALRRENRICVRSGRSPKKAASCFAQETNRTC